MLIERPEDMSTIGKLRLLIQSDGDVIVAICHSGLMTDIEFCSPGSGGGRSPETWKALHALAVAMRADNASQSSGGAEQDPTRWCDACGAKTVDRCKCGPIAEND